MPTTYATPSGSSSRRIAIVCRLGDAVRDAAAGFLAQLELEPLVLPDASGAGGTAFINSLDGLRDLNFAIVMLPAQELAAVSGGSASTGVPGALLLEIGFLLGALGRGRVCFLLEGGQAPAWEGVARIPMDDSDLWRLLLAREMKRAGLEVDLNRAL